MKLPSDTKNFASAAWRIGTILLAIGLACWLAVTSFTWFLRIVGAR